MPGRTPLEKAPEPDLGSGPIPAARYTSPEWMRREWEGLWTRAWLLGGRESDLAAPGTWLTTEIGPESVLIARGRDRRLRAFHNVCQHRGNRLCARSLGRSDSFVCPYHTWEWHLDGALKRVPDPETFPQGVPADALRLRELPCDTWGGWVWFSLDPAAGPLADWLEPIPAHLDPYRLDRHFPVRDVTIEWDCNWKTSVDAFNETYHVQGIHPQLLRWTDDVNVQIDLYERHSRMLVPFQRLSPRWPDQETITPELAGWMQAAGLDPQAFDGGAADVRGAIQRAKRTLGPRLGFAHWDDLHDDQLTDDFHYLIFPNVTLNVLAEGFLLFRQRPHERDPDRMYWDLQSYVYVPEGREPPPRPVWARHRHGEVELDEVLAQDAANLPNVQRGMHSRGFGGLWLSAQERRIRHFHRVLERQLEQPR